MESNIFNTDLDFYRFKGRENPSKIETLKLSRLVKFHEKIKNRDSLPPSRFLFNIIFTLA